MNKLNVLFPLALIALTSCTTVAKLESAPSCRVWETQSIFPPRTVEPKELAARYKGHCSIMGMFMCAWVEADLDKASGKIQAEGSSLFEGRKSVAKLNKTSIIFDASIFDNVAKASPATVDMGTRSVKRTVTLTALGINKSSDEAIGFNDKCSPEQAAVGAVALWMGRGKDM